MVSCVLLCSAVHRWLCGCAVWAVCLTTQRAWYSARNRRRSRFSLLVSSAVQTLLHTGTARERDTCCLCLFFSSVFLIVRFCSCLSVSLSVCVCLSVSHCAAPTVCLPLPRFMVCPVGAVAATPAVGWRVRLPGQGVQVHVDYARHSQLGHGVLPQGRPLSPVQPVQKYCSSIYTYCTGRVRLLYNGYTRVVFISTARVRLQYEAH